MTVTVPMLVELAGVGVIAAGLGALSGVGCGAIIVPMLVVVFGVPFRAAVAISLVGVVVNSAVAARTYVRQGLTHKRLAISLEVATAAGGIAGSVISVLIPGPVLEGIFGAAVFGSAEATRRRSRRAGQVSGGPDTADERAPQLPAGVWANEGTTALTGLVAGESTGAGVAYRARRLPVGLAVSLLAGALSGLLGLGGGFLRFPA